MARRIEEASGANAIVANSWTDHALGLCPWRLISGKSSTLVPDTKFYSVALWSVSRVLEPSSGRAPASGSGVFGLGLDLGLRVCTKGSL